MKKIISILIILVLFLLPFSILLNVNAVQISVDNNTTNGQGKKVLNESTDGVRVDGIKANNQFALYKVLDVYYDSGTNQMSYGFASNFSTFASAQTPALTLNDYLNANTTSSYTNDNPFYNDSAFTQLVSRYAGYIRANNIAYTYQMTTALDSNTGEYYAYKGNVEAGVYLVLPTSVSAQPYNDDGFMSNAIFDYSVLIANVVATTDQNNDWTFEQVVINAKQINSVAVDLLLATDVENMLDIFQGTVDYGASLNYIDNQQYSFVVVSWAADIPPTAHNSIHQAVSDGVIDMIDITYPAALTPDLTDVYCFESENSVIDAKIENNKYYINVGDDEEPDYREIANVTTSSGKISLEYTTGGTPSIAFNLDVDPTLLNTTAAGNVITVVSYSVKDPFVDIGTVTKTDIKNAFDTNDADYNSTKSVNIRKAIERIEQPVTLYTTGLTISNVNSDNDPITGAEFALYEYNDQTNSYSTQVGSNIVIENGTDSLNGIDPTKTYQLKQVKAPNGYRLNNETIVLRASGDQTSYDSNIYRVVDINNGIYAVSVTNQLILPLPFTGGIGTIVYTAIGLIIIASSAILIASYKKKQKEVVIEEL